MAWKIHDPQLAREARRIAVLVTRWAWAIAALIVVATCAGFFFYRYDDKLGDLQADLARIQGEADAITHVAGLTTPIDHDSVSDVLADTLRYDLRDGDGKKDHYAVYDSRGGLVAQIGAPPQWPSIRIDEPFLSMGLSRGRIIVEVTYADVVKETVLVGFCAVALAALVIIAMRAVPI
ncbi:MAG: hypothetical protein WAW96_14690, partial [Alphaproteobacteria bacterium]